MKDTINDLIKKLGEEVKNEELLIELTSLLRDVLTAHEVIEIYNKDIINFKDSLKISLYDLMMCDSADRMAFFNNIHNDMQHFSTMENPLSKHDNDIPF